MNETAIPETPLRHLPKSDDDCIDSLLSYLSQSFSDIDHYRVIKNTLLNLELERIEEADPDDVKQLLIDDLHVLDTLEASHRRSTLISRIKFYMKHDFPEHFKALYHGIYKKTCSIEQAKYYIEQLPSEQIVPFQEATLNDLQSRIDENDNRICDEKPKTVAPLDDNKVVVPGSQFYAKGPVTKTLEGIQPNSVKGVHYASNEVTKTLEGGACTALTMKFLRHLTLNMEHDLNRPLTGADRIERAIDQFKEKHRYLEATAEDRNIQAIMNTIRSDNMPVRDFHRTKVESLASLFGFQVEEAVLEHDFNNKEHRLTLEQKTDHIQCGTYLIRMIKPSYNDKQEEYGHTCALVINRENRYFYDPNFGFSNLKNSNVLTRKLTSIHKRFDTPFTRIYPLEKSDHFNTLNLRSHAENRQTDSESAPKRGKKRDYSTMSH